MRGCTCTVGHGDGRDHDCAHLWCLTVAVVDRQRLHDLSAGLNDHRSRSCTHGVRGMYDGRFLRLGRAALDVRRAVGHRVLLCRVLSNRLVGGR